MTQPKKARLGRPATGLPRYYMDCGWYRHPKFAGLPVEALFLFEAGVGYCTEHATNGVMAGDLEQLSLDLGVKLSVLRKGANALLERGRWRREDDTIVIPGYVDHNPLAEEVMEFSEMQRGRGGYGNHVRHHVNKGVVNDECPLCLANPPATSQASIASEPPKRDLASEGFASDSHGMGWDGKPPPTSSIAPRDDASPGRRGGGEAPQGPEQVLADTWDRLARFDLTTYRNDGGRVTSVDGFLKTARQNRIDESDTRARAELAAQPTLDAVGLAELLDARCGPDDHGAARARREHEATTARLEADRADFGARRAEEARQWAVLEALPPDEVAVLRKQAEADVPVRSEHLIRGRMLELFAERHPESCNPPVAIMDAVEGGSGRG